MTARELRQKYLRFFESKGHTVHPSGSLIPVDVTGRLDESLLFNGAGMVQFKPYFRGVANPPNPRLATAQKCVRTGDIEEVGNLSHLTFFEMLGNFSFGDYFKKEAIAYSWEFLTSREWLGLDPKRLSFTVFEEDDEAYGYWAEHLKGVDIDPETRLFRLGEETNYWPAGAFSNGPPGPCGPNSEMFYWTSNDVPPPPTQKSEAWIVPPLDGEGVREGWQADESPSPQPSPVKGEGALGYSREQWLADDAAKNWLEIWNDVFIQFEWQGELKNPDRPADGYQKTGMPNLPFQSIDTGMGLERTTAVLNGLKSVYDTDLFAPIMGRISALTSPSMGEGRVGVTSSGTTNENHPSPSGGGEMSASPSKGEDQTGPPTPGPSLQAASQIEGRGVVSGGTTWASEDHARAARIIADHIRTACFCIADGILPSNNGRGYVLRRLIRRAVLKGARTLGFEDLFLYKVYDGVVEALGDHYGELIERKDVIVETLKNEEALFRRTLAQGFEELQDELSKFGPGEKTLAGAKAFQLYDTFGFPLEVTQELCEEAGVAVDLEGYEAALKEAQERSRAGSGMESVYGGVEGNALIQIVAVVRSGSTGDDGAPREDGKPTPTRFLGYDATECPATIVGIRPMEGGKPSEFVVALDQTPFYAESGGQVSDSGMIQGNDFAFHVSDVVKQDGVFVHLVELISAGPNEFRSENDYLEYRNPAKLDELFFGKPVLAKVAEGMRKPITRHHTATHLLHAALRQVLGKHVTQAGSLVAAEHLRFDFTHGKAMTPDEISQVEKIVNEQVLAAQPVVIYADVPIDAAKQMGAMALFGEKYADKVRVVQIGAMPPTEPSFSRELCGGVHVRNTGEIGLFKIVHESSAASGVRRIEAISGTLAYQWAINQQALVREVAERLKSNPHDVVHAVEKTLESLKEERKKVEKLRSQGAGAAQTNTQMVGPVELATQLVDGEPKEAAIVADRLADNQPNRVVLVGSHFDGKVTITCKIGADAVAKGAHAGNLVREVAKLVGGGGGGRPDFATAGGKDASALAGALEKAAAFVGAQVGS